MFSFLEAFQPIFRMNLIYNYFDIKFILNIIIAAGQIFTEIFIINRKDYSFIIIKKHIILIL